MQRCCVHKLRNLERKAPKHALAEIRDHFHRIVYAANADSARTAYAAFERTLAKRCPAWRRACAKAVTSCLRSSAFPSSVEDVTEDEQEFRRRVKTQGSLPSEDAALVLLFSLVVSGQIKLRRIDGWQRIAAVLRQRTQVAA